MRVRGNFFLRSLDRLLGPPILLVLRLLPLARRSTGKRVLLLSTPAMGDTILATGVTREVLNRHPGFEWCLAGCELNRTVFKLAGLTPKFLELDFSRPLWSAAQARRLKPDLVIDLGQWSRVSAIIARLSGARLRFGFSRRGQGRALGFNHPVAHRNNRHELANYLALFNQFLFVFAEAQGLKDVEALPRLEGADYALACQTGRALWKTKEDRDPANPQEVAGRDDDGREILVLHFFAGGYSSWMKNLTPEQEDALLAGVAARGYRPVLTGSDADRDAIKKIIARNPGLEIVDAGGGRLEETAGLLGLARAVIAVNTGVMHLAAAGKTPLVAVHGPTDPLRWGPVGDAKITRVVGPKEACRACLDLGGEYFCLRSPIFRPKEFRRRLKGRRKLKPGFPPECVLGIEVEEILAKLDEVLGASVKPSSPGLETGT